MIRGILVTSVNYSTVMPFDYLKMKKFAHAIIEQQCNVKPIKNHLCIYTSSIQDMHGIHYLRNLSGQKQLN